MTVVKGNQKAPFSIVSTPKCRGGHYFFPLDCSTLPLICTLYCWLLSKEVSSTILKVFGMTRPGIEPRSPGPLANTLPTRTMSRLRTIKYQLLFSIRFSIIFRIQLNSNKDSTVVTNFVRKWIFLGRDSLKSVRFKSRRWCNTDSVRFLF